MQLTKRPNRKINITANKNCKPIQRGKISVQCRTIDRSAHCNFSTVQNNRPFSLLQIQLNREIKRTRRFINIMNVTVRQQQQ